MTVGYFSRDLYIPLGIYIYFCGDIYIPVGIYIYSYADIYIPVGYIFLWGYIYCKKKSVQCTPNMVCYVCPVWNTLFGVRLRQIFGVCFIPN